MRKRLVLLAITILFLLISVAYQAYAIDQYETTIDGTVFIAYFNPGPFGPGESGTVRIITGDEVVLAEWFYYVEPETPENIILPGIGIFKRTDNRIEFFSQTGIIMVEVE